MGDKIKKTLNSILCGVPIVILSFLPMNKANGQMIARDKQLHLAAGAVLGAWGTLTTDEKYGWKKTRNGMIAVGVAGIGKETYDVMCGGKFDLKDLAADFIGGAVSTGIIKLCTINNKNKPKLMTYGSTIIDNNQYIYSHLPIKKNRVYN